MRGTGKARDQLLGKSHHPSASSPYSNLCNYCDEIRHDERWVCVCRTVCLIWIKYINEVRDSWEWECITRSFILFIFVSNYNYRLCIWSQDNCLERWELLVKYK
jgi:hypothetical protein